METRPLLTHAEFSVAVASVDDDGFPRGRGLFISPATSDDHWNTFGSTAHARLTEAQRVLMAWQQVLWGGVYSSCLAFDLFENHWGQQSGEGLRLISLLGWPELIRQLQRVFRRCVGDPATPEKAHADWRRREKREIAMMLAEVRSIVRVRSGKDYADEDTLMQFAQLLWGRGEIQSAPVRDFSGAGAFKAWLELEKTKTESIWRLRTWLHDRQDELCRRKPDDC
jgi:hypothetical protein